MAERMDISKKKVITPEFRVSFPAVFEPKLFEGKTTPEYSVVMLFDKKTDLAAMKKAAAAAGEEKWGADRKKWPKNLKSPFRDGDEKSDVEGYEGTIFVTAKSKNQPGLVNQRLQNILDPNDFYAGCYARAEIVAFAYDQQGNRGIAFSLFNLQKLRDGDSFGGRRNATEVFEVVDSDDEDADGGGDHQAGYDTEAAAGDDGLGF